MKVQTIDVQAKEWFDKTYGNSYFSATITVNYGLPGEKTFALPFQDGFGDHYLTVAMQKLEKEGLTKPEHYPCGQRCGQWS